MEDTTGHPQEEPVSAELPQEAAPESAAPQDGTSVPAASSDETDSAASEASVTESEISAAVPEVPAAASDPTVTESEISAAVPEVPATASDPSVTESAAPAEVPEETAAAPDTPEQQTDSAAEQPASEKDAPAKPEQTGRLRELLGDAADLLESAVTAIFVVMLLFAFLLCTANVEGDSMVPTLENGNRLLVSRIGRSYDTGDILILRTESAYLYDADGKLTAYPGLGSTIVKRLIAQSGQEVNIDFDAGIVYVDGRPLDEPYTNTLTKRDNRAFTYPLTVPEGYIFVLGDNRHISKDSRHPEVGLIPEESIVGKVLLRVTPLTEFGIIDSSGRQ